MTKQFKTEKGEFLAVKVQAQDLRIGNLVKIHGHKGFSTVHTIGIATQCNYVRVNYIDEENNDRISNGYSDEMVHPIPLTEEILLKVGFMLMNQWFDYELDLFRIGYITNDEYFQFESNGKVIDIKSLHQLQNIIYFNTNKELNIDKLL